MAVGTVKVDGVRVTKAESYGEAYFEHVCHWVKLSALSEHSFRDLGADPWVLVHNRNRSSSLGVSVSAVNRDILVKVILEVDRTPGYQISRQLLVLQ